MKPRKPEEPMTPKKPKKKVVKAWAWVFTDNSKQPLISIDETESIVAEEKRRLCYGDPYSGKQEEARKIYNKFNRSLYKNTKVVPVTITYSL